VGIVAGAPVGAPRPHDAHAEAITATPIASASARGRAGRVGITLPPKRSRGGSRVV
jgi:hypothetical protein